MLLSDAIDGYWLTNQRNFSRATVADYSGTYRKFQVHIAPSGIDHIDAITADHINAFLNQLAAQGLAKKTQLNAWTALSSLWTWAEGVLGIPHVVRGIPRPRVQRHQPDPYTAEQVRALLDAAQYSAPWEGRYAGARSKRPTWLRDRAIMLLLLDTGMRASELCALKVADYDRKNGRIQIAHGKGDKPRVVFAGYVARQAIWRYQQDLQRKRDGATLARPEPLFGTSAGRPLDRSQLLHMIRNAGQRAGIPNANAHRFRHTCAVTMLRNGASAFVIQEILGHVDMSTIRLYIKLAEIDLEQAMRIASPADAWRL
jgi:integrase/recombinase XerD